MENARRADPRLHDFEGEKKAFYDCTVNDRDIIHDDMGGWVSQDLQPSLPSIGHKYLATAWLSSPQVEFIGGQPKCCGSGYLSRWKP